MTGLASVQDTSLDVVWIRDGVVCLGQRLGDRCYRSALAVQGPPEAFAQEIERVQPMLDGFAGFLNAFGQPSVGAPSAIQILVRAEPGDLSEYATRLESRAKELPRELALQALADATWARQTGPALGLLPRHAYVVIPAESLPGADVAGRLGTARSRLGSWFRVTPGLDEAAARKSLDVRCGELCERLARCGVWAQRIDDAGLTRLFQACWSRRRDVRFEQDLRTCAPSRPKGTG
jgi:hypothetical protein